jgi:predicted phage terminase large subunit-like protein
LVELRRQVRATRSLESLWVFFQAAWKVLEPGVDLEVGWHIEAMCWHIQQQLEDRARAVAWIQEHPSHRGDLPEGVAMRATDLSIQVPPRSLKTAVLTCATAWAWLHWPTLAMMYMSTSPDVSTTSARRFRDLVTSAWYRDTFRPAWEIRGDQEALGAMGNTAGGVRRARGLAAKVTGSGCIAGAEPVATEVGDVPIAELCAMPTGTWPRVWSRASDGRLELRRVVAARMTGVQETVLLGTDTGDMLECTDDHRIFVGGVGESAYEQAARVAGRVVSTLRRSDVPVAGESARVQRVCSGDDDVRALREPDHARASGADEVDAQRPSGPVLLGALRECGAAADAERNLRPVPANVQAWHEDVGLLLEALSGSLRTSDAPAGVPPVRALREPDADDARSPALLLDAVQERGALRANEGHGEPELLGIDLARRVVPPDAGADPRSRRPALRGLQPLAHEGEDRGALAVGARPPHRLEPDEQRTGKPALPLHEVPQPRAQGEDAHARRVRCTFVEPSGRGPVPVYDIEVEGNHNFFASGVLVHNCAWLIIDDPHDLKDSDDSIASTVSDYKSAVHNRINDPRTSIRTLIMQRVSAKDLATAHAWHMVVFPMEYEPGRVGGEKRWETVYGFRDPREEGWRAANDNEAPYVPETLHPRFTPVFLAGMRIALSGTASGYAGQMQQRPSPAGGGIFKRAHWRFWRPEGIAGGVHKRPDGCYQGDALAVPILGGRGGRERSLGFDFVELTVDCAFKGEATSDRVSIQVVAALGADRFVLHDATDQRDIVATIDAILDLASPAGLRRALPSFGHLLPPVSRVLVEDKANGPAIMRMLQGKISGLTPYEPGSDSKDGRARATCPGHQSGNYHLLDGAPWLEAYVQEFDDFPKGKFDDRLDAWVQFVNYHVDDVSNTERVEAGCRW